MIDPRGFGIAHGGTDLAIHKTEIFGHENDENGAHAVEGKTLSGFVANDVGNAWRHGGGILWRMTIPAHAGKYEAMSGGAASGFDCGGEKFALH